jgi:hypothetical protein
MTECGVESQDTRRGICENGPDVRVHYCEEVRIGVAHFVVSSPIHIVINVLSACNPGEVKLPGHISENGRQFLGGRSGHTRRGLFLWDGYVSIVIDGAWGVRLVGIVGVGHGGVVVNEGSIFVLIGIIIESSKALFQSVFFFKFDVESGRFRVFGCARLLAGKLLPFEDTCPVLTLFLIEFVFPFGFGVLAIFAVVAALVAA